MKFLKIQKAAVYVNQSNLFPSKALKLLKSFLRKKECRKPVEIGYSYCLKHILEDPTAPYRQCEFVLNTKKKEKRCKKNILVSNDQTSTYKSI